MQQHSPPGQCWLLSRESRSDHEPGDCGGSWAGLAVVFAIAVSAAVAGFEAIDRLINPSDVTHLGALAAAGGIGYGVAVGLGAQVLDPLIGLGITLVILRITWQSWQTVRAYHGHEHHQG